MTLSKASPRAGQRWLLLALGVAVAVALSVGAVAAIHGTGTEPDIFELDGNAHDQTPAAAPNPDGTLPDDWDAVVVGTPPASSNFLDRSFIGQSLEGPSADQTYYTGGATKDDINIDTVAGTPGSGGWLRDISSSAQPKAEILNAYAAAYKVDSDGSAGTPDDTVVYFGMDRYSNDGATFGGFWFLQNPISYGPSAANGVGEIHGSHVVGDILVITDFTQGGAVANFKVFQWVGSGGDTNGTLDELYTGTDCNLAPANVTLACSTINGTAQTAPWSFTPKANVGPAGTFQPGLFIEGGINVSQLIPGNTDPCFSTFIAETRASFSVDSTLSDFAAGSFNTCGRIEATKYHDRNVDGARDADGPDNDPATTADNEEVLSGWRIFIDANGNELLNWTDAGALNGVWDPGEGERWATTGSDGKVTFADLPAGNYSVCEVLDNAAGQTHAGWFNSDPAGTTLCEPVTVGIAGATARVDFGNYQNATKSGSKFLDRNADGTWDPNGVDNVASNADDEVGLADWTINAYVDTNGDGVLSATEFAAGAARTDDTDSNGDYTITGLTPGTKYIICEVMEASSWLQSHPADDAAASECSGSTTLGAEGYAETFGSGENAVDNDFGNYQNATVSGTKFKDVDGDDSGFETGDLTLQGWQIRVYADVDLNGVLSTGDLFKLGATTDSSGNYSIAGLAPGKYLVCEVAVANWVQADPDNTVCAQGGLPANDPLLSPDLEDGGYAVTLTTGQTFDADFVNTPLSNVHVTFFDLTGSTDAAISCVNASSLTVEDSDTTDESATPETSVQNNGLVPGTYTCTIVITDP